MKPPNQLNGGADASMQQSRNYSLKSIKMKNNE